MATPALYRRLAESLLPASSIIYSMSAVLIVVFFLLVAFTHGSGGSSVLLAVRLVVGLLLATALWLRVVISAFAANPGPRSRFLPPWPIAIALDGVGLTALIVSAAKLI